MINQQIEQIEMNIQQAKSLVELGNALDRLGNNPDFIRVIDEGYFKNEAVRLVHLKAAPSRQSPEGQAEIIKDIDGIGALLGYLQGVQHRAMLAETAIASDQETLSELMTEGEAV